MCFMHPPKMDGMDCQIICCQNQLNEANESENNSDFEIYVNRYDCTAEEYIKEHHLISHEELFNDLLAYSERITYPKKEI